MRKRTKIISTLGPSTTKPKILTELIAAGTDVFRLNLSHAKIEDAKEIINNLKLSSAKLERPVAIMVDLQGHKIRLSIARALPNPRVYKPSSLGQHEIDSLYSELPMLKL